jgi:hypothetical protein
MHQRTLLSHARNLASEVWTGKGFLVGEPHDFRKCRATSLTLPTYAAFFFYDRRFFESDPLTTPEFNYFKVSELPWP